jgi:hypothetical protein
MKIKYEDWRPQRRTMALLDAITDIVEEYKRDGYTLSLRQIHYQFVTRGLMQNNVRTYARIGRIIASARNAGLLDWNAIVDRHRATHHPPTWNSSKEALTALAAQYAIDRWMYQEYRPFVVVEKDALVDVVEKVCRKWQVPFAADRGYNSISAKWRTGRLLKEFVDLGYKPVVLLLSDHDPSGMDLRTVAERDLSMYAECAVEVEVLALTMEQIEAFNLPPNPAKEKDPRFKEYRRRFGETSWELDALPPRYINDLIENAILRRLDMNMWHEAIDDEAVGRTTLTELAQSL